MDHCPGSLSALWGWGALPLFESAMPCGSLPGQFVCTVRLRYPYHCLSPPCPVDHCPGSLSALWGWGTLTIVWVNHSLWIIAWAVCLYCEVQVIPSSCWVACPDWCCVGCCLDHCQTQLPPTCAIPVNTLKKDKRPKLVHRSQRYPSFLAVLVLKIAETFMAEILLLLD